MTDRAGSCNCQTGGCALKSSSSPKKILNFPELKPIKFQGRGFPEPGPEAHRGRSRTEDFSSNSNQRIKLLVFSSPSPSSLFLFVLLLCRITFLTDCQQTRGSGKDESCFAVFYHSPTMSTPAPFVSLFINTRRLRSSWASAKVVKESFVYIQYPEKGANLTNILGPPPPGHHVAYSDPRKQTNFHAPHVVSV